ncbi:MAG: HSP20 family small heat-shock protein [Myxococcota bacterium]
MANLSVRKESNAPSVPPASEWDPFRMMRDLMSWDPFRGSPAALQRYMDRYASFVPAFEVKENKEGFVFKGDMPGVKENDVDVTITDNRLTISGKREAEQQDKHDTWYTYERTYGSFSRTFQLPEGAETSKTVAELKDGVLSVFVPRKAGTQPLKIAVRK